jgi:16S rRNA (cytosine967-C5)-methyltransferase
MKPAAATYVGKQHNARTLALHVLGRCRRHDAFLQEILDEQLTRHALSAADRRLTTQLTYGVLRRRGTLHALLAPLVTRPAANVEPWLWDALYLGAYQLALMNNIPFHAAINETVELAAAFGRPGAKAFLNGVLRGLAGLVLDERTSTPGPDALPMEKGEYRRLARPMLPDLATQPVEYLAAGFGLPHWLASRWAARYDQDECRRLGFWFAGPGPLTLRSNALRTNRETLLQACRDAGINAEPGEHPQSVRVNDLVPIRDLPGYDEGWFTVQDEASMRVATALAPVPGMNVLDLCAAPGGKTTHLAELMHNQGRIVACDIDERRLETVKSLAARLRLTIIETRCLPASGEVGQLAGAFDAVLVDVPCSNTGVLGRRPEVRWRLRPDDLTRLVALQVRLLRLAARCVGPGGTVVYSTCSSEPEENQEIVRRVGRLMKLESEQIAEPGKPGDGGYLARLRRTDEDLPMDVDAMIRPRSAANVLTSGPAPRRHPGNRRRHAGDVREKRANGNSPN